MSLENLRKDELKQILKELLTEDPQILSGTNVKLVAERYPAVFRKDIEKALETTGKKRNRTYQIQNAIYSVIRESLNISAMAYLLTHDQYEQAKDTANKVFEAMGYTCRIQ